MRVRIFFPALLLLATLLTLPGCTWFREAFDETPEQAEARRARQAARAEERKREATTGHSQIIPELFPTREEKKRELFSGSDLSPRERQLIEEAWGESGSGDETEIFREQMRKSSEQNADFVFGTGILE